MTVQEGLAQPAGAPAVETPDTAAAWERRSSDELRAIVQRGIQGGESFFAAAAEMERRARENDAAARAEQAHVIHDDHRRMKLAWAGLLTIPFALAVVARLIGLW